MTELLAILDGEDGEKPVQASSRDGAIRAAGANPMGRALPVTAFAFLFLMGMLAHPRTRKFAFSRLAGAASLGGLGGRLDEIAMHSTRELGTGQRVVALEIDGYRVLVGVSAGRMDLLHTWEDIDGLIEDPDRLTETMFDPGMILSEARRPQPAPLPASIQPKEDIEALRKRVAQATPSPQELLAAFGAVERPSADDQSRSRTAAPPAAPAPPQMEETPWWMEGATGQERDRLLGTGSATESVLEKMRQAKERGATTTPPRPTAAVARRATQSQPPRPSAGRRGPPRFVLGLLGGLVASAFMMVPELALAADGAMQINIGGDALAEGADAMGASTPIKLLITMTLLAVAPAIILSMTSFTRLIIIFSLMRQAVGVQQAPPNQILIGLALFLTWFIMGPTFTQVNDHALQPYFDGELTEGEALEAGMIPMRKFMLKNTRKKDLALFLRLSATARPKTRADVPTRALVPAFIISELKTAFQIGFLIYIPFLIIDLVVATVLLAMGMMVLPPVVISLPFKLLLFVFIDGWNLLVGSVVQSFA
jgi:flagellar biosynthetic protein FliP